MKINHRNLALGFCLGLILGVFATAYIMYPEDTKKHLTLPKQPVPPPIPRDQIPRALGGTKSASQEIIKVGVAVHRKDEMQAYMNAVEIFLTEPDNRADEYFAPIVTELSADIVPGTKRATDMIWHRRVGLVMYMNDLLLSLTSDERSYLRQATQSNPLGLRIPRKFGEVIKDYPVDSPLASAIVPPDFGPGSDSVERLSDDQLAKLYRHLRRFLTEKGAFVREAAAGWPES